MGGRDSEKTYKKVANEDKRVRFFDIKSEIKKELLIERLLQAIRFVADFPRETKPMF